MMAQLVSEENLRKRYIKCRGEPLLAITD
jgi:hypothetical protein